MTRIMTTLISVSDKTGLPEFGRRLADLGVSIISTGGTARLLKESGVSAMEVAEYTGFPEILGGRVKTLHPRVLGGLLARRGEVEHQRQMEEHGIEPIDMVVVNLYPFVEIVTQAAMQPVDAVNEIDIGGASLIRAAAKNYTDVAVVTNPETYDRVAEEMERNDGRLSPETRFELAVSAFRHTAHYDTAIARYLSGIEGASSRTPERITIEYVKKRDLRHGENPHQAAALYVPENLRESCAAAADQLAGPDPDLNQMLDLELAVELCRDLGKGAAAVFGHAVPCAATVHPNADAGMYGLVTGRDPDARGCALFLNDRLSVERARSLEEAIRDGWLSVVGAAEIGPEALDFVASCGEALVFRTGVVERGPNEDLRRTGIPMRGGGLVQNSDAPGFEEEDLRIAAGEKPTADRLADMRLTWLCAKHARSLAAAVARDGVLRGVMTGRTGDLAAVHGAIADAGAEARGAVLAVDAALMSPAVVDEAAKAGISAIVQPGGGPGDDAVLRAAERVRITMALTGVSHIRH